ADRHPGGHRLHVSHARRHAEGPVCARVAPVRPRRMGVVDRPLDGASDGHSRRHLAVDALHLHRHARRHREPAARPDRSGADRRRLELARVPRHHLALGGAGRRDGGPDPAHRSLQDHRPAQRADRRRPRSCNGINDPHRLHFVAYAGPRQLGRSRLSAALRRHSHLRLVLQLRGQARAEVPGMTTPRISLYRRLFEPAAIDQQAMLPRIATYAVLIFWTLVVLFPLYWVLITSLKGELDVSSGPFYLPFIDFHPNLDAWRFMLIDNNTLGPYLNSVVVAVASTLFAVLIGALAAYALVRIRFKVTLASIGCFLALLAVVVVAVALGTPWPVAAAVAVVLFILFLATLGRRFKLAIGNNDIEFWMISNRIMPPIVTVLPIYIMFQNMRLLDTQLA